MGTTALRFWQQPSASPLEHCRSTHTQDPRRFTDQQWRSESIFDDLVPKPRIHSAYTIHQVYGISNLQSSCTSWPVLSIEQVPGHPIPRPVPQPASISGGCQGALHLAGGPRAEV